jgi:5-methylcytosine-specific restriction enzyme B
MTQPWDEYLDLQAEDLPTTVTTDAPATPPTNPPTPSLDALAHDLCLPLRFVEQLDVLLRDKRQLVLAGPPGTGKTYIARQLASFYSGGEGARSEFLQFHPSYSYEDFVEGYKPRLDGDSGALMYSVEPGPLLNAVRSAQSSIDQFGEEGAPIHVMVIDELNRANLARVFGELFFALEYRNEPVRRQYSPEDPPLRLPKNLWFIGTMNTADRSTALFDAALRRRFYFINVSPLASPFDEVLRCYLNRLSAAGGPDLQWLADLLAAVNENIPDERYAVGPSYFMREDLTLEIAKQAWDYTVVPYLADRFESLVKEGDFDWNELVKAHAPNTDAAEDVTQVDGEPITVGPPPSPESAGENSEGPGPIA